MITKKQFIKNVVKYDKNVAIGENIKVVDYLKVKGIKACRHITISYKYFSIEQKKEFIQQYFNVQLVIFFKGFYFIYNNKKKIIL